MVFSKCPKDKFKPFLWYYFSRFESTISYLVSIIKHFTNSSGTKLLNSAKYVIFQKIIGNQSNVESYSVQLNFVQQLPGHYNCQVKFFCLFLNSPFVWSWRTLWYWNHLARSNSANRFSSAFLYLNSIEVCHHHHPPQVDCLVAGFWTKCTGPLWGFHEPKPVFFILDIWDIWDI